MSHDTVFLVPCTACGTRVPRESTYFSASGEVCGSCHAAESAADSATFAAGADNGTTLNGSPAIRMGGLVLGSSGVRIDITGLVRFVVRLFSTLVRR